MQIAGAKNLLRRIWCPLAGCYTDLDETVRQEVIRRQTATVRGVVPLTLAANSVCYALLWANLRESVVPWKLLAVSVPIFLGVLFTGGVAFVYARQTDKLVLLRNLLSTAAVLRGASWALFSVVLFPDLDFVQQMTVSLIMVGLMSSSAFGLSLVPAAGLGMAAMLTLGGLASYLSLGNWNGIGLSAAICLYFFYMARLILLFHKTFVESVRSEIRAGEQEQTINLLLREFEESRSDWLWETDAQDRFISPSARFVEAAPRDSGLKTGMAFKSLFGLDGEGFNKKVFEKMAGRQAIAGVTMAIPSHDGIKYWSLTGRPQKDEKGEFCGYRGVAADITEKALAERRLLHLAHTDQLTELTNRAYFSELLDIAFGQMAPERLALLTLDLNGFKMVNDTLGHAVGDALLVQVGERLNRLSGPQVIVARLGGDEFAILLTGVYSIVTIDQVANEAMRDLSRAFTVGPHSLQIDCCLGFARGARGGTPSDLMLSADLALYAAKAAGRGQRRGFEPEMAEAMVRRQNIENELRSAIDCGELSLQFQPIVEARTGVVNTYEALLRWHSSALGHVSPDEFIPIAEESGLIVPIGRWVLEMAAREAALWPESVGVCINVSPVQLRQSQMQEDIASVLAVSGLDAGRLTVEITEGVFMENSDQIATTLKQLLATGIKIALDDFGSGYSSVNYLRSFPFSKIKIDKSFVDHIETDPAGLQLIRTIIEMANALGFEVVAEGVETQGQLDALQALDCDYVQGYLFSRPLPAHELVAGLTYSTGQAQLAAV